MTLLSEKTLFLGQKLTVIQGDIASVGAEAIVHSTNSNWNMTGSVGNAIREVAGQVRLVKLWEGCGVGWFFPIVQGEYKYPVSSSADS